MLRVLQIVESMHQGGIQAFLMNVYRNIDRTQYQFDFLVFRKDKQLYEDEIISLGGKVYKNTGRREGILKCRRELVRFFAEHKEYEIVHYNASSLSFVLPLEIAYKMGVKTRIIHGHSSSFIGNRIHLLLHRLNKTRINRLANVYISCGEKASQWMYGNTKIIGNEIILFNGIDLSNYVFSEVKRERYRNQLGISDNFVVGHVGRFSAVKNHLFLLKVFEVIKRVNSQAILLLVGDGELKKDIENIVSNSWYNKSVLFLGNRKDVAELLMAMDLFIFPSLYEGFPVTVAEAQAVGTPILISDTITKEVIIGENIKSLSLSDSIDTWVNYSFLLKRDLNNNLKMKQTKLDILQTIKELEKIYQDNSSEYK